MISMKSAISTGVTFFLLAATLVTVSTSDIHAQAGLCPTTIPGQTNFAFQNGTCTNGNTGAFSGAALASQALSDLSQSTTQETLRNTVGAVQERRAAEEERCPDGFVRRGGTCERVRPAPERVQLPVTPRAAARVTPSVTRRSAARVVPRASRPAAKVARRAPRPTAARVVAQTPVAASPVLPPIVYSGPRFAVWSQAFGDFENRSGRGTSTINCCTGPVAGGIPITLDLTVRSKTQTGGIIAGLDATARNIGTEGDGLIVGALAGYQASDLTLRTASTSRDPANLGNGRGELRARLTGPSAGLFATYFNGGFSTDLTLKADFLDLNESFFDNLAFTANLINGVPLAPAVVPFFGRGSTAVTTASAVWNVNYRFPISPVFWIEPTAGVQYTATSYGSGAALLGLDDGYLVRVQGGARLGLDTVFANGVRLTTTVTGLVYDDVEIHGGFIQGAAFGTSNILAKSDEGKLRGRGILALNLDFGGGVSSFVQGEVRGGQNLHGGGGRVGMRVEW